MQQLFSQDGISIFLLLFSFITGIYLTFKGKPYSSIWAGLHKIATLALGVLFFIIILPALMELPNNTKLHIYFYLTIGLFLISLITGAIAMNLKSKVKSLLWAHRILPLLCYASGLYTWLMAIE